MVNFEVEITPNRRRAGNFLQKAANIMCHGRVVIGSLLAVSHIAAENPYSWRRAGISTGNYGLDKVDGVGAREAAELLQRPPTPEGKKLDEKSDKQLHRVTAIAHSIRAIFRERKVLYGLVTAGNLAAQEMRDVAVHKSRDAALIVSEATGIDIDTGATTASKRKLGAVAAGDVAGDSPLPKTGWGRTVVNGLQTFGTILSYRTGSEIIESLDEQMLTAINTVFPEGEDDTKRQELMSLTPLDTRQQVVVRIGRLLHGQFSSNQEQAPPPLTATAAAA